MINGSSARKSALSPQTPSIRGRSARGAADEGQSHAANSESIEYRKDMRTDRKPCAVFGADDVEPECTLEEFEAEEESEVVRQLPTPDMPTRSEFLDHCVTHYPYRSWCKHCVEGRGREFPHRLHDVSARGVPTVSFDYAFV